MRRGALAIASLLALLAVAALAGCGVSVQDGSDSGTADGGDGATGASEFVEGRQVRLPPRPAGVIRIDGATDTPPTDELLAAYRRSSPGVALQTGTADESEAFNDLCRGDVDIVASTRPISRQEYQACQRRSVKPVQIQLASDAAILAIRNETDVGVDCLTLGEVQEIFRAGSPIQNWSQVGFLSSASVTGLAPSMKVTGPDAESSLFEFFSAIILDTTVPSLASVRGDYTAHEEARGVRLQVIGGDNERLRRAARAQASREILSGQEQALADARRAEQNARFEVRKGVRDRRPAAARARDRRRLEAAEKKVERIEARLPELRARARVDSEEARRLRRARGTLGLFGFTYYEVWEEQLRPMEIDTEPSDAEHPNCIFPSTQTVSDATYPLARQTLLTVPLQRLREAEIQALLAFAVRNAADAADELGLVPLPDELRDEQLAWIGGETAPDVIFYPVSSTNANKTGTTTASE